MDTEWMTDAPMETRSAVGVMADDGVSMFLADHCDRYEVRVGNWSTIQRRFFGVVQVAPESRADPHNGERVRRLAAALQELTDLGVVAYVRNGLVCLEVPA
jgi:hypothetical protein